MNSMLKDLRSAMAAEGIYAYIIFNTDPNNSEYIPHDQMVVRALTGFSGDNAIVIVTPDFAGLWTDSRFFISGDIELRGSGVSLMKKASNNDPGYMDYLRKNLPKGSTVAMDGNLISQQGFQALRRKLEPAGIIVRNDVDLTPKFWLGRPDPKFSDVFLLGVEYSGMPSRKKIDNLFSRMLTDKCGALILTNLDDIAWLLNLRGGDIEYCPLIRSFMLLSIADGARRAVWFVDGHGFSGEVSDHLEKLDIHIMGYSCIYASLKELPSGTVVQVDCSVANSRIASSVPDTCTIQDRKSPVQFAKAIKNDTETRNLAKAMLIDGLAMERFFYRMESMIEGGIRPITELMLADMLLEERQKGDTFFEESFQCISAFNEHAAMPHYAPSPDSNLAMAPDAIYLVDSGGQYLLGTTDITRTIATGSISPQFAKDYTLVLMGNIELAMAVFPEGTTGHQLDALARMHMWRHGRRFGHGTGHGVGYCLNCHEGPQSISTASNNVSLKEGMVITDEPGIYIEGQYGIRTENMLRVCKAEYDGFLKFDVMTLCHIDTRPVLRELMTQPQIDFLNEYNERVFRELSPHLDAAEAAYLRERTKSI